MGKKKRRNPQIPRATIPPAGSAPEAALGTSIMARRPEFALWNPQLHDADSAEQWERDDQRAFSRRGDPQARSPVGQCRRDLDHGSGGRHLLQPARRCHRRQRPPGRGSGLAGTAAAHQEQRTEGQGQQPADPDPPVRPASAMVPMPRCKPFLSIPGLRHRHT